MPRGPNVPLALIPFFFPLRFHSRAIVYNSALSYADFTMLSQFMTSQYGSLGIDVVVRYIRCVYDYFFFHSFLTTNRPAFLILTSTQERFKAIAVHIGSFPGRYDMARRIQRFRDQWGQTGRKFETSWMCTQFSRLSSCRLPYSTLALFPGCCPLLTPSLRLLPSPLPFQRPAPALPASVMETSVWEVATIVRYIILSRRCPALNFQPSLSWPDDPYAAAYITRLSESGPAIIRGSLAVRHRC